MFGVISAVHVIATLLCCGALQGANVLISVDNTGANDPVSVSAPRIWNFAINTGYSVTVDRALFGLNDAVNTTASITCTIWQGLGGPVEGNEIVATISLAPQQVDNFYSTQEEFYFGPVNLVAGFYSVSLTTTAQTGATTSYFLKNGSLVLKLDDGSGDALSSDYWTQDANNDGTADTTFNGDSLSSTPVPEPTMLALVASSVFLVITRRRG